MLERRPRCFRAAAALRRVRPREAGGVFLQAARICGVGEYAEYRGVHMADLERFQDVGVLTDAMGFA